MTKTIPNLKINSQRLKADFDALSDIGATIGGGVSRLALSNEDLEARAWFADQVESAGFWLRDDEVGNLSGVLLSADPHAKTLLIGSHLDTVPNGGRYDGTIGVLAGLECLRVIHEAKLELPVHLEVIDFTDEEGNWQSLFGSMGLAGLLKPAHINDSKQDNGAFRAALFRAGIRPDEIYKAYRAPESLLAYLELHIEQGYHLHTEEMDIGVVTGIVGRKTYTVNFLGEAAHSGTTAMSARRDALQGAASFILHAHELVRESYPDGVFNCGNINVKPGTFNTIPAKATLTIECRHSNPQTLLEMESALLSLAETCAGKYQLHVHYEEVTQMPTAPMSEDVMQSIERACDNFKATHRRLISYSGHDAQILSTFIPSGMIFVPSINGISHNPKEYTPWEQIELGANILLRSILDMAFNGVETEDVSA